MHTSIEELKAVSLAAKNGIFDPDTTQNPDLFLTRPFTADEMGDYDGEPLYPGNRYTPLATPTTPDRNRSSRRQQPQPRLKPYSVVEKPVSNSVLKSIGWNRRKNAPKITYLEPDKWIDLDTGEILPKAQAHKLGAPKSLHALTALIAIYQCPPTKRDFVAYILKLRNRRGGLKVDLRTALDTWIRDNHPNIDSTDRSRKRKALENVLYTRAIMADNQTLTRELQINAYSTKKDNLGEEAAFRSAHLIPGKPGCGIQTDPLANRTQRPAWWPRGR